MTQLKRSFFWASQFLAICLLCSLMIVTQACNFSAGLEEIANTITKVDPFINLIPAFVCPFDPTICPAVTATDKLITTAMGTVSQDFSAWSSAAATAQPGLLSQLIVAVNQVQNDQASLIQEAQVKNSNAQTVVNGVASSIEGSISDLLTLLQQAQASGGTSAALASMLKDATPGYDEVRMPGVYATFLGNPLRVFASPNTLKLKGGKTIHTYHYYKAQIVKQLSWSTTDTQVKAICVAQLKVVKGL